MQCVGAIGEQGVFGFRQQVRTRKAKIKHGNGAKHSGCVVLLTSVVYFFVSPLLTDRCSVGRAEQSSDGESKAVRLNRSTRSRCIGNEC